VPPQILHQRPSDRLPGKDVQAAATDSGSARSVWADINVVHTGIETMSAVRVVEANFSMSANASSNPGFPSSVSKKKSLTSTSNSAFVEVCGREWSGNGQRFTVAYCILSEVGILHPLICRTAVSAIVEESSTDAPGLAGLQGRSGHGQSHSEESGKGGELHIEDVWMDKESSLKSIAK
jgi:hypothetical protein